MQDDRDWMLGRYFYDALGTALHNAFLKKGGRRATYNEEPYLKAAETQRKYETGEGLTEEEKKAATDFLFASLSVMQANFENSKRARELDSVHTP